MGRRVCAREKRSCTLGKGGKCFEDRIMEGRTCCWWAWEQWLGFCQVGGRCTCEVGLVRPYPSSASPELHGDTHRYIRLDALSSRGRRTDYNALRMEVPDSTPVTGLRTYRT
jgi:hypothetical protein